MPPLRLPERILCLVTDIERAGGEEPMLKSVDAAVTGGVNMVQVRAHNLDPSELTVFAKMVVKTVAGKALVIVNGPVEAALEAQANGIHLPESAELSSEAKKHGLLVGKSIHSVGAAEQAVSQNVDYLIAGTIFPSESHPGGITGGIELMKAITQSAPTPVIGIGGINASNAHSVIGAGACGVAVIGAIIGKSSPTDSARRLTEAITLERGNDHSHN